MVFLYSFDLAKNPNIAEQIRLRNSDLDPENLLGLVAGLVVQWEFSVIDP